MTEITRDFINKLELRLQDPFPLIQILLGPRQIGKTFGIKQLMQSWKGKAIYQTADMLSPPKPEWIMEHWKYAESQGPGTLLILDEIQKIPEWSEAVKLLFDEIRGKIDLKIVILGSTSLALLEGMTESLAGRYELIKVSHWDYEETLKLVNFSLDEFLLFGGYPSSYRFKNELERWQEFMIYSIIEPVLTKDIQGSRKISKPALFRRTFELIMRFPAQTISLQKLLGQLQDNGNTTTIKHYLNLFEGAFLIRQLDKFSNNEIRRKAASPKLIPMSTSLCNAFDGFAYFASDEQRGRYFEAAVGVQLTREKGELSYWSEGDYEVDFILERQERIYAIEVKSGRSKKAVSMGHFLKRYPKAIPVLISRENIQDFFRHGLDGILVSSK